LNTNVRPARRIDLIQQSSWFHPRRLKRMKRIGGAKSARWLVDSLRRFDWIAPPRGELPRKIDRFASKVLDLIHAGQPFWRKSELSQESSKLGHESLNSSGLSLG
jgi:hypothetical protein